MPRFPLMGCLNKDKSEQSVISAARKPLAQRNNSPRAKMPKDLKRLLGRKL
jgi:hypothetical protein